MAETTTEFDQRLDWWFTDAAYKPPEQLDDRYVVTMLNDLASRDGAPAVEGNSMLTRVAVDGLLAAMGRRDAVAIRDFMGGW